VRPSLGEEGGREHHPRSGCGAVRCRCCAGGCRRPSAGTRPLTAHRGPRRAGVRPAASLPAEAWLMNTSHHFGYEASPLTVRARRPGRRFWRRASFVLRREVPPVAHASWARTPGRGFPGARAGQARRSLGLRSPLGQSQRTPGAPLAAIGAQPGRQGALAPAAGAVSSSQRPAFARGAGWLSDRSLGSSRRVAGSARSLTGWPSGSRR
jgi:hypothetical protein